ncbi:MAG: LysM peptidoglycan-binding domain-containing protein [Bacteroidales bacterium]
MKQIVIFFVALLTFTTILAQENVVSTAVERSRDKVKIDGKTYFIHIVKSGETLYAIGKAYDITQSEIATNNPDIYSGLKVGQALKIPAKSVEMDGDEKYIYHIVKKKETLFGLSRQYNVSIDDIVKINPEVKNGLEVSQVVLIPRFKISEEVVEPAKDSLTFIIHEVQPKEGLFAISRRYGVDSKEIEFYNKDVIADGVKLGTSLRIPVKPKVDSTDVTVNAMDENKTESPCKNNYSYDGRPFNIALFLPFSQAEMETSDDAVDDVTDQQQEVKPKAVQRSKKEFSQVTQASLAFYEGFLVALDTMKKSGVSVNLSVFDTKRSKTEVESLLHKNLPGKTDLIIGSFITDDLKLLADFAVKNDINLVSPLYSGPTSLPQNSHIISINQSFKKQLEIFIRNFKFEDTCKYVVVYDKENLYSSAIKQFDSLLTSRIKDTGRIRKIYHHTAVGKAAEVQDSLMKVLAADRQNVVIIPSEDEPFVSEFLGHLYGVKSFHNLRTSVYGPSRWLKMKNIPSDYFYKLDLHVFTPFFVDYSLESVKHFIATYRELYRAEPSQYAYLGYDVGLYFISAMKNFGVDFNNCLSNHKVDLLQSKFQFGAPNSSTLFQNRKQFIINYTQDFDVIKKE